MSKYNFVFALITFLGMSFVPVDKKFPNLNLKTLEGKTVELNKSFAKNKLTVVSYWATWCSPCKKELDAVKNLYEGWKKDGIEVIAVTIDNAQQLNKVKPLANQKKWSYTVLSDVNSESLRLLNFQTIPQTFVVNSMGEIVYSHSGYTPGDEFELDKKLKSLMGK